MLFHICYPRYLYEVRGEDVEALHIRDLINGIHGTANGGFHAQDSDLHKLHVQFHEYILHHVQASMHDRLDVD